VEVSAYLVDSSAYSRYRAVGGAVAEFILSASRLAISPVVLGELRAGFLGGTRRERNEAALSQFLSMPGLVVTPIAERTADVYAELRVALKSRGRALPTNDIWIAASAREHGLTVLTADKHFLDIEGLSVEFLA
jgi:tRNA(fMet)-specific endonuclease VapC